MLGKSDCVPTVAVKDLGRAREFYEGTLGLEVAYTVADQVTAYVTGNTLLLVYVSEYAGTNEATAVTWGVGDDVDGVVEQLKAKGVSFEHYDLPGTTREGDIHVMGDLRAAWFEDPDGNIHSLVQGSTSEWRARLPESPSLADEAQLAAHRALAVLPGDPADQGVEPSLHARKGSRFSHAENPHFRPYVAARRTRRSERGGSAFEGRRRRHCGSRGRRRSEPRHMRQVPRARPCHP